MNNHNDSASAPPPIKSRQGRVALLAGAGAVVAGVLLVVIFNIDTAPVSTPSTAAQPSIEELIPPARLTEEDVASGGNQATQNLRELGAENTWIQTTRNGKLAQQYRFVSHDPNPEDLPPGWSKVIAPEIHVYFSDDRVMTLRSDTAMLRVQGELLESGRMTGHVVIRMYRTEPNRAFDPDASSPTLETRTQEAFYDHIQGEVRCDGAVDVQTATAHLPGAKLRVQINEVENRIEWLQLETVGEIRLASLTDAESNQPPKTSDTTARPARPSAPRPAPPPNASTQRPRDGSIYRLTFHKNIHIQQGDSKTGWTADGDDLHVIFSMESKSLGRSLAFDDASGSDARPHVPLRMTDLGWSMILSAAPSDDSQRLFQPSDTDIIITCDGGLSMTPLTDSKETLPSADDATIELEGSPLRLHSFTDSADVVGHAMRYHTRRERLELRGSPSHPLTFDSPQLRGEGELFWFNRLEKSAGFDGEGWLVLREKENSTNAPGPAPREDGSTIMPKDLRIQWQEHVAMTFDESRKGDRERDSLGRLRQASFTGNVEVTTDEVFLRADSMTIAMPPDNATGNNRQQIESIVARGSVRSLSLTDQGSLACDSLDLRFNLSADGRTIPAHMIAIGAVAAVDKDHQTVWSDRLEIVFLSPEELASAENAVRSEADSASSRRAAQVKSLLASDNVQVLLADGARAFADRLEADGIAEKITLTGSDLMVLNGRAVIYHGKRLDLDAKTQSAQWAGGGRFVSFTTPIATTEPVRIARPVVDHIGSNDNPVEIRATWSDSMSFDGTVNDGAGSLLLSGQVQAESQPTALEHNTLSSQSLTMQFVQAAGEKAVDESASSEAAGAIAESNSRQLKLLVADGNAKLESRSWLKEDHSDTPRVFYLAGPQITYDDQTLEASVPGGGELLVRDEQVLAEQPKPTDGSIPFSGKGTTLFRWSERLHMKQQAGALYDIEMIGGVQVRHMALDKTVSTMTGKELHATVERLGAAEPAKPQGASLDFGGSMELRRLRGLGGMYLRTPTREIDCEDFEYDYSTGIAAMNALPGRSVMVKTSGNPNPLRAARVVWNIIEDKISATNVRGSAPR